MSQKEILAALRKFKADYADKYGIITLGLFGSAARGQDQQGSDIDVVVKLEKQDLFNLIGIKQDLEQTLNTNVDVVSYREKMNAFLKNRIDRESIYV